MMLPKVMGPGCGYSKPSKRGNGSGFLVVMPPNSQIRALEEYGREFTNHVSAMRLALGVTFIKF